MPIITLIQTTIQLLLSNHSLYLTPRTSVAIGGFFLVGWIVVASIWTECEIVQLNGGATSLPGWCPQSSMFLRTFGPSVVVKEEGLAITENALGWLVTAAYVVYVLSAGIAWWRERRERIYEERRNGGGTELESLGMRIWL
jgi:hypothetical protein